MDLREIRAFLSSLEFISYFICIIFAIFGSFVKTYGRDSVTNIIEIFKQVLIAAFTSSILILLCKIYDVEFLYTLMLCGLSGYIGDKAVNFIALKLGKTISSVGSAISDFGKNIENMSIIDYKKQEQDKNEKL